jgi:hypothetical protein
MLRNRHKAFTAIEWVKSFEFITWEDSRLPMLDVTMSSTLSWTHLQMNFKSRWIMPILKSMFLKPSETIELSKSKYKPHTIAYLSVACPVSWSRFLWSILARSWISYYSPQMILYQCNLDYGKHCQYAFGTYIQAHNEPDPSNITAPCTLDCIYLWYSDNEPWGHDLLHLQTNCMITRHWIMPIPITLAIVNQVNCIAKMDGMLKRTQDYQPYPVKSYEVLPLFWSLSPHNRNGDFESRHMIHCSTGY